MHQYQLPPFPLTGLNEHSRIVRLRIEISVASHLFMTEPTLSSNARHAPHYFLEAAKGKGCRVMNEA